MGKTSHRRLRREIGDGWHVRQGRAGQGRAARADRQRGQECVEARRFEDTDGLACHEIKEKAGFVLFIPFVKRQETKHWAGKRDERASRSG